MSSPLQTHDDGKLNLPPPPPTPKSTTISECHQEHNSDLNISPTPSQSNLEFYSNQSLSYSLSSSSIISSPLAQPQSESDYDSFTDIVHLRRRGVQLEKEATSCCRRCLVNEFQGEDYLNYVGILLITLLSYSILCLLLGPESLFPGSALFTLFFTWVTSLISGFLVGKCGLPPLLGMLITGLLLRNLTPSSWLILPEDWKSIIRASSLAVILMRSGLELNLDALKKSGLSAFRLTLIPGVIEAITVAFLSYYMFNMPVFMALSLGFILAAVSPAVVVVGMFNLKRQGYGVKHGVPSLVVAAASFDDIIAISGFTFCISLAIQANRPDILSTVFHGPLSLVIGVIFGTLGGIIIIFTKIWNKRWKRSFMTLALGMAFTFGLAKLDYPGAGAIASIIMGIVGSICWRKQFPQFMTGTRSDRYVDETEKDVGFCWSIIFEPLLFGVIGMSLDFNELQASTIPKSVLIIVVGLMFRLPSAYFATSGKNFTFKERLFIALAWSPKATVQAALCSVPLELINATLNHKTKDYLIFLKWGHDILTTAVLSILITAPIGLLVIQILGPKLLDQEKPEEHRNKSHENEKRDSTFTNVSIFDYAPRRSQTQMQLELLESSLTSLEGKITAPEAIDIIVEARQKIVDTKALVSIIESTKQEVEM